MTVAAQSTVNYTYDNANRLTQITQGTATVTIGYDNVINPLGGPAAFLAPKPSNCN